jgi:sirohydrochlorin ferrochelatase
MTAVILLAHGSPDPRSSEATHALAARLEGRTFDTVVRAAFLQHDEPTLAQVALELARTTVSKVRPSSRAASACVASLDRGSGLPCASRITAVMTRAPRWPPAERHRRRRR